MTLTTPDAFLRDWYGWITNEAAHALFVGLPIFALLAALTPLSRRQAVAVTLALYGLFEVATYAGDLQDGVTDFTFVAAGAVFGKAAWEGNRRLMAATIAATLLAGIVGIWGRV